MSSSHRETPQAVFATAQSAIARADWETFFACLDQPDLLRIAKNGVGVLVATPPDAATRALCAVHGFPLDDVYNRGQRIAESSQAMRRASSRELSLQHKALVDAYTDAIEAGLRGLADLAGFTAALERRMRSAGGSGSVSSRLFADETLADVVVEGGNARGKRRSPAGAIDEIAFVQRKDDWRIRLPLKR